MITINEYSTRSHEDVDSVLAQAEAAGAYAASLSIPSFTGGRFRSDIASSSLQIDRLKREQEDLKNEIALEVKTALTKLEAALKEVSVARY